MTMKMKTKMKMNDYLIQISTLGTLVNDGSAEAAELGSEPSGIDFGSLSVPFSVFLLWRRQKRQTCRMISIT